jgi:hypothetical protein
MPAPEKKPHPLKGKDVPIPEDMPELPDDLTIIARLIDANCRAHSEKYGWHLDSRCLSHYNEGIVRLVQAGMMDVVPVLDHEGNPKVRKVMKKDADTGAEFEDEELVYYEEITDAPAQAMRVRAKYVPFEKMTDRPTTDPLWKLQGEEMARLRHELSVLRANPPAEGPEGVAPAEVRAQMAYPPDVPEWAKTAPRTPQPDPKTMPGSYFPKGVTPPAEEVP